MRVGVIGAGGREQALGLKLAQEGHEVHLSPGNPGNDSFAYSTTIPPTDISEQLAFAKRNLVDFTIVGADDPLALGIVDSFQAEGLSIFGPTRSQMRIESDRSYAKTVSRGAGVPSSPARPFRNKSRALEYAKTAAFPLYVKDNGLRQGKGAVRCESLEDFQRATSSMDKFLVEQYVEGPEASLHSLCDGTTAITFPLMVRDHKRLGPHDQDPMTGGMGTIGPLPDYNVEEVERLHKIFAQPIVRAIGFKGLLFSGLKGNKGEEVNLEYNARFGDPEAQVYLSLLKSELLPALVACMDGEVGQLSPLAWKLGTTAVCLVLAAPGYPDDPVRGEIIEGIDEAVKQGVTVLQAATRSDAGALLTNGGRVLNIVSVDAQREQAVRRAYLAAEQISFGGAAPVYRKDIGA